jgi:hypothetical protein
VAAQSSDETWLSRPHSVKELAPRGVLQFHRQDRIGALRRLGITAQELAHWRERKAVRRYFFEHPVRGKQAQDAR